MEFALAYLSSGRVKVCWAIDSLEANGSYDLPAHPVELESITQRPLTRCVTCVPSPKAVLAAHACDTVDFLAHQAFHYFRQMVVQPSLYHGPHVLADAILDHAFIL